MDKAFKNVINIDEYVLAFEEISLKIANAIDYESRDIDINFFSECQAIHKNIHFKLHKSNQIIFDSRVDKNINFKLGSQICQTIKPFLNLSTEEKNKFLELCKMFLNDPQNSKMPLELLIAQQILNGIVNFTIDELENMEIKKYEKIQLAVRLLNETEKDVQKE